MFEDHTTPFAGNLDDLTPQGSQSGSQIRKDLPRPWVSGPLGWAKAARPWATPRAVQSNLSGQVSWETWEKKTWKKLLTSTLRNLRKNWDIFGWILKIQASDSSSGTQVLPIHPNHWNTLYPGAPSMPLQLPSVEKWFLFTASMCQVPSVSSFKLFWSSARQMRFTFHA